MAIEKILVVGVRANVPLETERVLIDSVQNQPLSRTIVDGLVPASYPDVELPYHLTLLTYPSQEPYLPSRLPVGAVEHKTTDSTDSSLEAACAGQDLVISTIAGGDYDFQVRLIDAASIAGVKRFIPHEFGQDTLNKQVQGRSAAYAQRAKVIQYLQELSRSHMNFEWVAIGVGTILDTSLTNGNIGFDMQWQSASIQGSGNERFAVSSMERVGEAIAGVVRKWDVVKNGFIYTSGCLTCASDVLACLEKSTGRPWTASYSETKDSLREADARIERGFPDAGMFLLERTILYDDTLQAVSAFEKRSANDLLQLQPETVEAIVGKALHEYTHHGTRSCACS